MSKSKIIDYLLQYRPSSEWICNNSNLPYLQIGMQVPVNDIYSEWLTVSDNAVLHRDTDSYAGLSNQGWKSLSLYGISDKDTVTSVGSLSWTMIAKKCPVTVEWLNNNFCIDSTTGRIRFMLLEPNGYILPHKDRDNKGLYEINVPIINPDGCTFRFKNYGTVPFEKSGAFLMDVSNEHFVYNNSNQQRLHIIVHAKLKNEKLIVESYANRYYH